MTSEIDIDRFARHLVLKEIGGPGQQALARAHVAIVGAGGLGAPAALYLAAAGVGTISLIDADTVTVDNLQRQIIFRTRHIGSAKAKTGARELRALNPGSRVRAIARPGRRRRLPVAQRGLIVIPKTKYESPTISRPRTVRGHKLVNHETKLKPRKAKPSP